MDNTNTTDQIQQMAGEVEDTFNSLENTIKQKAGQNFINIKFKPNTEKVVEHVCHQH